MDRETYEELADELLHIPRVVRNIFLRLDFERYSLLKRIAQNGGFIYGSLKDGQADYFRDRGIIFAGRKRGEDVVVMPAEVMEEFNNNDTEDYKSVICRNTEWIKLIQGILYYYGTLEMHQVESMIEKYTGETPDIVDLIRVSIDAACFYGEINVDLYGFSSARVWDRKRLSMEQKLKSELNFYSFTREELIRAGEPGFVERNYAFKQLISFIHSNYDIPIERVEYIVEQCVYAIKIGESSKRIMEYIKSNLDLKSFDTAKALLDNVAFLINNTRQWFLKGYMLCELMENKVLKHIPEMGLKAEVYNIRTCKKVQNSDLCPCGSRNKFGKCCGA